MTNEIISMKTIAEQLNDITYTDYYYRLMLLARSVFEWENLPPHINEKWIERYLFHDGECVFFKDAELGLMVAGCTDAGSINAYDEPTKVKPVATNYMGPTLENGINCVVIKNNDIRLPTKFSVELFAFRLADISRTIDINIAAQKTPAYIQATDRQKRSMQAVFKKWNGYEPLIIVDKNMDTDPINVIDTKAPVVFDKLQIHKHAIWNEAMTFLGVNNANMDKRERLVDDEVQANNEQVELAAQVMLKARQRACDEINKMFNLNISVKLRDLQPEALNGSEVNVEDGESA